MSVDESQENERAQLSLWDTVSLIIGVVVGVTIFKAPGDVFSNVDGPWQGLGVWLVGGALSLVGALCFAEMAAAYPRSGGPYVYLTEAFGRGVGFLFGWAQLAAIITGSVGAMAFVFADYAADVVGASTRHAFVSALVVIALLTLTNICGLVAGKSIQNLLTVAKLVGISLIVAAGAMIAITGNQPAAESSTGGPGIGLAMILVLYAYGGWGDAAYVTSEVRDRRRNVPLALIIGVGAVTCVYLAVNIALLAGLGFDGVRASSVPAADLLGAALGPAGSTAMSTIVIVSALGALNAMILMGSRVYVALGADHPLFARLAVPHARFRSPVWSLAAQAGVASLLVLAVGTEFGRGVFDNMCAIVGLQQLPWDRYGGGFELLVAATAPVFWLFLLLTGVAVFVLRTKGDDARRPFSLPLYPLVPLLFCGVCCYMLYASVKYANVLALLGAMPLVVGVPLFLFSERLRSDENHEDP